MWRCWFYCLASWVIGLALPNHTWAQQPGPTTLPPRTPQTAPSSQGGGPGPANSPAPPPPAKPDPAATKALTDAIQRLDPERTGWLDTTLWERIHLQGLTFSAHGRYVLGPKYRLRLVLNVDVGGAGGVLTLVSDGTNLSEVLQVGSVKRGRLVNLQKVLDALKAPATPADVRTEYLQDQSFLGIVPLLKTLKERITFTEADKAVWNGRDVLRLRGSWAPELKMPPPERFPPFIARHCVLYLDAKTLWPYRLEWWGYGPPRPGDSLLVELEFREPRLGTPAPAEDFKVQTDDTQMGNDTERQLEMLKVMAQRRGGARTAGSPTAAPPDRP